MTQKSKNPFFIDMEGQKKSGFPFARIWLLLLFFFLSLNLLNDRYDLSRLEYVYEILLWISTAAVAFLVRDKRSERLQFLVIVLFFGAIWGLGLLNPNVRKWNHVMILVGALGLFASFVILAGSMFKEYRSGRKVLASPAGEAEDARKEKRNSWKAYLPVLGISLLFFLFSYETFSEIPHLDSTLYYSRINKLSTYFDYSFSNVPTDFRFYKHLSMGYALFALLGEEIQSYTTHGVHFVNFALALLSGISFYAMLETLYPDMGKGKKYLGMAVYLLSPFVLGTLGYFNVDLPAIYFFVLMLSCRVRGKRTLGYFAAYGFIFTKEPSVIYYCFYLLGLWLGRWQMEEKKTAGNFFKSIGMFLRTEFLEIMLVVLWLESYFTMGSTWGGGIKIDLDNSKENLGRFGFTLENMLVKSEQIFILNFNWVFVLIILVTIFWAFLSKKKRRGNEGAAVYAKETDRPVGAQGRTCYRICLASSLAGVLAFAFLFIDLLNPRYIALGSVLVLLIGLDYLMELMEHWEKRRPSGKTVSRITGSVLAVLILAQSMVTIDPVSYVMFDHVSYFGKNMFLSGHSGGTISERTIYNREYNYFDRIVEKILDEADYQEGDLIFFAGHFPNPYGYQPGTAWDQVKRRLTTVENENTVLLDLDRIEISEGKDPKRIIMILELDQDSEGWECQTVRYRSMEVKYYVKEVKE